MCQLKAGSTCAVIVMLLYIGWVIRGSKHFTVGLSPPAATANVHCVCAVLSCQRLSVVCQLLMQAGRRQRLLSALSGHTRAARFCQDSPTRADAFFFMVELHPVT
jgi:hypothetical protein